jgi:outer membrane protein assembly factor BamE (lipoprotein component of BamABCDE complex)
MRIIAISLLLILVGCVYAPQPLEKRNSSLTQGNVQMNLKVGKTTKAEVLEIFGSPNVTTRNSSGQEMWTFQRAAQVNQSSSQSGYWTIILAGKNSKASGFESSSRMITLIINFDANDLVADFSSRESNF